MIHGWPATNLVKFIIVTVYNFRTNVKMEVGQNRCDVFAFKTGTFKGKDVL